MLQSITGTLRSTMILAELETWPEGLTRANRRGCMIRPLQFPFGPELIGGFIDPNRRSATIDPKKPSGTAWSLEG
jgi:hypothetical protein